MRHFIRYAEDGELVGVDTRTFGWPANADLTDPSTEDKTARWFQAHRGELGLFEGWVEYKCPCPRDLGSCLCAYGTAQNNYYNGVALFPKPALTIEAGGVDLEGQLVRAVPGSILKVRLKVAAPDGHSVTISDTGGQATVLQLPQELFFTSGLTPELDIVVPPQGVSGTIRGESKYVRGFMLSVCGWA